MQFSDRETSTFIEGPAGILEAIVTRPHEQPQNKIAVICHPHPLYGGTMQNKVVTTIVRAFSDLGIWAVRFNFRGVGKSKGSYDNGKGELQDLQAVLTWCQQNFPNYPISLAGFSFGAFIAIQEAGQFPCDLLLTVAPPVHRFDFTTIQEVECPWILIQGDDDEVVPAEQVYAWANSLPKPPQIIRMPAASHFFHGQLVELRELIKNAAGQ